MNSIAALTSLPWPATHPTRVLRMFASTSRAPVARDIGSAISHRAFASAGRSLSMSTCPSAASARARATDGVGEDPNFSVVDRERLRPVTGRPEIATESLERGRGTFRIDRRVDLVHKNARERHRALAVAGVVRRSGRAAQKLEPVHPHLTARTLPQVECALVVTRRLGKCADAVALEAGVDRRP